MPHVLPPLPYDYKALEPHIDEQTMRLHHDKHHQAYVDGLNKAEQKLAEARTNGDYSLVKHWEREVAFHGSGHMLHTIFWPNMSPQRRRPAGRTLNEAIRKDFGNYEGFKNHFQAAAVAVEGSGWAILAYQTLTDQLVILGVEKHQDLTQFGCYPAAGARRLGARLLPQVPEPPGRLREGLLQRDQLERCGEPTAACTGRKSRAGGADYVTGEGRRELREGGGEA